jgi:hypothetical protein
MGLPATLSSWHEISDALAAGRQHVWSRAADDQ